MKIIILAAGLGSRMNQELPKCACLLNNKPMIKYLIETCNKLNPEEIILVVGYKKEKVIEVVGNDVTYIYQQKQLGTANAVLCCYNHLSSYDGDLLIIPGDTPLVPFEILRDFITRYQNRNLTILTTKIENPSGLGRIKRDKPNNVLKIIEEYELTEEEKKIKEVNTGIYLVNSKILFNNVKKIDNNNNKQEYYLTDIVEIIKDNKDTYLVNFDYRLQGINDFQTLKRIEGVLNS